MTNGLSRVSCALLLMLLVTWSASAADATSKEATLAEIHYAPPAGWKSLEPPAGQSLSRMYAAPDAPQGQQALIILFSVRNGKGKFDFRASFDDLVTSSLRGKKPVHEDDIVAVKTRQGYEALSQTIWAEDDKGAKLFTRIVCANVDDRLNGFCYAAESQEAFDKYLDQFGAVLTSVRFGKAEPDGAAAAKPALAAAAIEAWDLNELGAPRAMSKEKKAEYVKEMDKRRKQRVVLGTVLGADGKPIDGAKIQIRVWGTTNNGDRSHYNLEVDDNGSFEQQVPDGLYKIGAVAMVTYNGHFTPLPLHAMDEKPAN